MLRGCFLVQLVWAPPINAFFFWTLSMMEDGDNARAVAGVKEKLWPTLKVRCAEKSAKGFRLGEWVGCRTIVCFGRACR